MREAVPGTLFLVAIGLAATAVSRLAGGSSILYALVFGIALHRFAAVPLLAPGMAFCTRDVLQWGVGFLGLSITASQFALLSPAVLALVALGVAGTIAFSALLGRFLSWPREESALAGAACAICGVSAAIALSMVIPRGKVRSQSLTAIVIVVSVLSAAAMVAYPFAIEMLGFSGSAAGIIAGATIHNVAQVVGAGTMLGKEALEMATLTKMLRVALLVPMMFVFLALFADRGGPSQGVNPLRHVPFSLIMFSVLALASVTSLVTQAQAAPLVAASRWFVLVAVAGIGVETDLTAVRRAGVRPVILMAANTLFLLGWMLLGMAAVARWNL